MIPPREKKEIGSIAVKEYGASSFLYEIGKDIAEELIDRFPNEGKRIFALAVLRVIERCPFKRADYL